jgi:hypothetical protein
MRLPRPGRRKTLHEELLERGARTDADTEDPESQGTTPPADEPGHTRAFPAGLALALLAASIGVHVAPAWLQVLLAVPVLGYGIVSAIRSRKEKPRPRTSIARSLFLVWLAVSVAISVLVAVSGYYGRDEFLILAVVWTILGVLWLADRWLHPGARPG